VQNDSGTPARDLGSQVGGVIESPPLLLGVCPAEREEKALVNFELVMRALADDCQVEV
jgi:hypothetical protein